MSTATHAPRPWFRVDALATDENASDEAEAHVYIYDEIGESWWGGLSPRALVDEITALDVSTLTVHVNSPGGAAWDGLTIMNALRSHQAEVHVIVDGLAASAASVIAMAGDRITMNRGATMMIHDASGGAWGNAQTLEETAEILHKLSDSYADVYAARAGGDRAQWRAAMQAETWYTAEEAVAAGLADDWDGSATDAASGADPAAAFDLSRFRFQGRAHAPTPRTVAAQILPSSTEPGDPHRKDEAMSYGDLQAGLRARLGVTDAAATDEVLLAAVDEVLAEQASTDAAPAASIPAGTQLIDSDVLAALQRDAAAGREAHESQITARRDGIIATALREGRITAASAPSFRAMLDADEEAATKTIQSLAANTVPVAEVGHSAGDANADDALYALAFGDDTTKGA